MNGLDDVVVDLLKDTRDRRHKSGLKSRQIFDNLIDDLKKRLATKGIGLKIDEKAKAYLIDEGFDPKNGARPLRRKIEEEVESLLSEEIIAGKLKKGDIPTLKYINKKLKLVKE